MSRIILCAALSMFVLMPETASAATGGGTIGGTNFSCEEGICTCNGSYADCKKMEINCIDGKVQCREDAPNICQCIQARKQKPRLLDKSIMPTAPEIQQ